MRHTPTFQSLSRPILVAGGERAPIAVICGLGLLCAVPAWFDWNLYAAASAVFLFLAGLPALRHLAKRDPQMIEVAQRYYAFQRHYPARTPVTIKRQ